MAVTSFAALIVTRHLFSPLTELQSDQETALEPAAGAPVSVTVVPSSNSAEQVPLLQLMPAGELVTVPEPVPVSLTVSLNLGVGWRSKVAVTSFAALIVTRHLFSPLTELQSDQIDGFGACCGCSGQRHGRTFFEFGQPSRCRCCS